jgi:signal transduction histidine kinase
LILLILFAATKPLFAQRIELPEALKKIKGAKNKTEKLKAELEASSAYLLVKTDSAFYFANDVLLLANKENSLSLKAGALLALGEAYSYTNQQIFSLEKILDARDIYENINDAEGLGHCYFGLGELYTTINRYPVARMHFFKSLELYKTLKNEYATASVYASLGDNYYSDNVFDSCIYFSNLAIEIGIKLKKNDILEFAYSNIADVLIDQKKLKEAEKYLNISNALSVSQGNDYGIAYGKLQEAKLLGAYKQYEKGFKKIDTCISIAASLKMDDLIMDAEKIKYFLSKEGGFKDQALSSLEKHDAIEDTLLGQKKYMIINDVFERFRAEKKQKEIEIFKERAKQNKFLLVALSGIVFLTLLLCFTIYKRFNERKKMLVQLSERNESIEKQAKNLQQINSVKDRMFSIISHDLRGPVSSLKGLIEFMKNESLSNEDSEMVVKELKQSVAGVDMLLENLLVWAQIQFRGDVSIKNEILNIEDVAKEVFFISTNTAVQKNIQLVLDIEKGITVNADRNHISLILRNLVNNSIKFTHNGGVVTIEVKHSNDKVKICVEDNGVGMSEEEIGKLFKIEKPYSVLGTENEKGSGLGLLFVKEYIQNCGGDFSITSTKGKGSRFCVTI